MKSPYSIFLTVKASFTKQIYKRNVDDCTINLVNGMEVLCWGISKPHVVRSARLLQGLDRGGVNLEYLVEVVLSLPDCESWDATEADIENLKKHGWVLCNVA
ncbi:MAG: hypothetical protein KBC33_01370 [Candidatus Pacebacteria bacterium]|nr:hypothetical protein [Candidatus Paceibacterota bacterium]